MERTEALQVLTLWFVVLIFVTTETTADSGFVAAVGLVAVVLVYALPAYLLVAALVTLAER